MQQRRAEHKKHIAMWLAVGGTMAVIVALWVLILPVQLQGMRFAGVRDATRWNAARSADAGSATTLSDLLATQRRRLEEIEKNTNANGQTGSAALKIDDLRAKIEAAAKKNEAPPATNGPANP